GEVQGGGVSKHEKKRVVRVALIKPAEGIAREGSRFWIVRPHVGFGQVTGLATVLSGPEINVIPGKKHAKTELSFTGLETPPSTIEGGLKIVVRAARPKMRV